MGKRDIATIAFSHHDTLKCPLGFRRFSPPGEMPPLLFGGKAGTVMIAFGNHDTIKHPLGFPRFLRSKMTGRTLGRARGEP